MELSGETQPFSNTPDPRLVYRHRQFDDAFRLLERGISEGKGFLVITGEVGAGKTTLMRAWLSAHGEDYETAVILNTGLDSDALLLTVAEDLGADTPKSRDRKSLVDSIHEKLLNTATEGRSTVIFIDEGQNLSIEALELLRMLSNLETEREKLVQIVLMGQDGLRELLARPELVQLKSRIAVHRHLRPLNEVETAAYVRHRLEVSGWRKRIDFAGEALRTLHEVSGGVPRRINIIADIALTAACEDSAPSIAASHIMNAADGFSDLDPLLDETAPESWTGTLPASLADNRSLATFAAWGILIAVLGIVVTRGMNTLDPGSSSEQIGALPNPVMDTGPEKLWVTASEGIVSRQFAFEADTDTFIASPPAAAATPRTPTITQPLTASNSPEDSPSEPAALLPNSRGESVTRLQNDLFRAGYFKGIVNGFYGPTTIRSVVSFQTAKGLPASGIFDATTSRALAVSLAR